MHASGNSSQMVELLPLFRAELDLCRLRAGERVLLYSDTFTDPAYPAACLAATLEAGAVPVAVTVPATAPEIEDAAALAALWRGCALVVDLVSQGQHGYTSPLNRAVESGTRILRVAEPPDVLARLFPLPEVAETARRGAALLTESGVLRAVSPTGTDLRMDISGAQAVAHYGFAETPGRWDHWPSALCFVIPNAGSAEGILMLAPGDALLRWSRLVAEPVACTIRAGRLVGVEGGRDARLVQEMLAGYEDPDAYLLSMAGWGCDPRSRWGRMASLLQEPGGIMDVENAAGNLLLVFGSNTAVNLRGTVRSAAHLNVNCRGQTVMLDGRPVIVDGTPVYA